MEKIRFIDIHMLTISTVTVWLNIRKIFSCISPGEEAMHKKATRIKRVNTETEPRVANMFPTWQACLCVVRQGLCWPSRLLLTSRIRMVT